MDGFRKRILRGETVIGSWIQTGSPAAAEILAEAGFDWVSVDMEHSSIGIDEFAQVARGIRGRGAATVVRVRENDTLAIRQALDMGAECVIVPMVNSREEAERAVAAAKYPPLGVRGFGWARCNDWGMHFKEYAGKANGEIAVIVMIESKDAVENIDGILSVDGVDGVLIGPYDMSGSYGIPGKTADPIIVKACNKVAAACKKHKKAAGQHIVTATRENVRAAMDAGFTFLALGCDIYFLAQGASGVLSFAFPDGKRG